MLKLGTQLDKISNQVLFEQFDIDNVGVDGTPIISLTQKIQTSLEKGDIAIANNEFFELLSVFIFAMEAFRIGNVSYQKTELANKYIEACLSLSSQLQNQFSSLGLENEFLDILFNKTGANDLDELKIYLIENYQAISINRARRMRKLVNGKLQSVPPKLAVKLPTFEEDSEQNLLPVISPQSDDAGEEPPMPEPEPPNFEEIAEESPIPVTLDSVTLKQAVFTEESNLAAGLPVYTAQNPAPRSNNPVAFTYEGNKAMGLPTISKGQIVAEPPVTKFDPSPFIPTTALVLRQPDQLAGSDGNKKPTHLTVTPTVISSRDEITVITDRRALLAGRNRSYSRIIGGLTTLTAIAALSAIGLVMRGQSTNSVPVLSSSTSANSSDNPPPKPPVTEQKTTPTPTPDILPAEKAIYKVDTGKDGFKKLESQLSSSPGLLQYVKRMSVQLTIHQAANQDQANKLNGDKDKQKNRVFMTGKEAELQQQIIMMDGFLASVEEKPYSPTNPAVNSYFAKIKSHFDEYKRAGTWSKDALANKSDKFFDAFQGPKKLVESREVLGYKPSLDRSDAKVVSALDKMKANAPTFESAFEQAVKQMPPSPYNDFETIKAAVCKEIGTIADQHKHPDYKSGIHYMRKSSCEGGSNPNNTLDPAINNIVAVYATPVADDKDKSKDKPPKTGNIHNSIAPDLQQFFAPVPEGAVVHKAQKPVEQDVKPGLLRKAAQKLKSFFGFGKVEAPKPAQPKQPEIKASDLPMYSLKETLKGYFWG